MARSPIGRRHPRPGSVPVIEYLAREPQAVPRVDQRWVPVLGEDGTIPPMPTGAERTDAPPATTGGNTTAITTAEVYREPHGERSAVAAEPPPASLPGDGDGTGHGGATHRGLTGPAEQAQVAGRGRVGRLAGIAAGVAMLCLAISTAATVSSQRSVLADSAPAPSDPSITGVPALRMDWLTGQLAAAGRIAAGAPAPRPRSTATPSSGGIASPATTSPQASSTTPTAAASAPDGGASSTTEATRRPPATSSSSAPSRNPAPLAGQTYQQQRPSAGQPNAPVPDDGVDGLVRRFYALIPTDPRSAAGMLSPGLLDGGLLGLLSSWHGTTALQLQNVEVTGRHSAIVTVLEQGLDGRWMRVRQLITTTSGETPLISGVRLLSAQSS